MLFFASAAAFLNRERLDHVTRRSMWRANFSIGRVTSAG
jgi:hypothetical protein